MTSLPLAHETWFPPGEHPLDWSFAGEASTLALLGGVVGIAGLVRLLARRWPGVDLPALARLAPFMPFAVRIHLAVSLLGLLSLGYYLSPAMNLQADAGLGISDLEFTRLAGGVEVLFGLLLISGALPLLCVLIAAIPFNTTLWFFGSTELVGHLPVYAVLLVLLAFGSEARLREAVSDPWPWRRPTRPRLGLVPQSQPGSSS